MLVGHAPLRFPFRARRSGRVGVQSWLSESELSLGGADFESGWSLKSSDVPDKDHRPAAGRTFNRIRTISREGGIGLIRTPNDDDEIITVGEWKPNCATFRDIDGVELKGVQMARFGLFVPHDGLYNRLDDVFDRGGQTVDDLPDQEPLITQALDTLAQNGRLRTPTYL